MSGLASMGQQTVLNSLVLNSSAFVSLHLADPGDTGATEIVDSAYARQGPTQFTYTGSYPMIAGNNFIVAFPSATVDWGTVAFFGVWDQILGGRFMGSGPLDTPRLVLTGDLVRFLANALKLTAQ